MSVVQRCAAAPWCARRLPDNLITWLERKGCRGLNCLTVDSPANATAAPEAAVTWNYAKGGADWNTGVCQTGKMQSPIRIEEAMVNFTVGPSDYRGYHYIMNMAYTPVLNLTLKHTNALSITARPNTPGALGYLVTGCCGARYVVKGFHFHLKSEHTFSGRHPQGDANAEGRYPMELHIIHQREGAVGKDGLLIVVVLFDVRRTPGTHRFLDSLDWTNLPSKKGMSKVLDSTTVDLNDLAYSLNGDYFSYNGSLSTPGCDEGVEYRVMYNTEGMSQAQYASIMALQRNNNEYPRGNYRDLQARNGRKIVLFKKHSFVQPMDTDTFRKFVWVRTERPAANAVLSP